MKIDELFEENVVFYDPADTKSTEQPFCMHILKNRPKMDSLSEKNSPAFVDQFFLANNICQLLLIICLWFNTG